MMRIRFWTTLLLVLPAIGLAHAQMAADVRFNAGDYGTTINGTITGNEYFDYRLGARSGQEMSVKLTVSGTNGHGTAYLNILPPGSDGTAIYIGSMDEDRSTSIRLSETGDYTIRVYLMGNDRDAGKTVGYKLDVSVR